MFSTWFLSNNPDVVPQPADVQSLQVVPIKNHLNTFWLSYIYLVLLKKNLAGIRVVEPLDQLDTSGLATA